MATASVTVNAENKTIMSEPAAIHTDDLDLEIPNTDTSVAGLKRPASAPTPDSETEAMQSKKARKQHPSYNWGHLYWQNTNNPYRLEYNEKNKQWDFLSTNNKRFAFTIPGTKALTKFLRRGGNHGAFSFSKTEDKASINTMLIFGTFEKYAELHSEFRKYIEEMENTILNAMWNNDEIHEAMIKKAEDLLQLPPTPEGEDGTARTERVNSIAKKLFFENAQRVVKPGDDGVEWTMNAKTRAFYETIKNSGEYRAQDISYFNGATPEGEEYEKFDDDYQLGNVALISVVLRPQGFTTPGFSKYGLSFRLGHEVVVYKDLGSANKSIDRDALMDTTREIKFVTKTMKSGQQKLFIKNSFGADFTFITENTPVKYNIESNLNKFDGKIKKDVSKVEGTLEASETLLQYIQSVQDKACDYLLKDDTFLSEEKEKMKKTAEVVEKTLEDVFRSNFQSPIRKDGTLKVSVKEYYETDGEWTKQPFPIEDAEGNLLEDERIQSESVIQIPLKFSVYCLSSGIYGMKMDINNRIPTRIVEEAGFVKGAPPVPKFDF